MIFYFSGTGNSEWVARYLAQELSDHLVFIPDEIGGEKHYTLHEGERLGFVFPCYGWGVPTFIEKFIQQIQIDNVSYIYFVTTCGDDTGLTADIFCDIIASKGWTCTYGSAVQMPESYVCLPGFDTDPEDKEHMKLQQAVTRVNQIIDDIIDSRGGFDTLPGKCPWIKSRIIRPVFNSLLVTPRRFKTNDFCTGCANCVHACPYNNIQLSAGNRPVWGDQCVQCMRCYHQCPTHAIEWGPFTKNKGQYLLSKSKCKI